jgi:hypothetical protein
MDSWAGAMAGRYILIVEDDYLIAPRRRALHLCTGAKRREAGEPTTAGRIVEIRASVWSADDANCNLQRSEQFPPAFSPLASDGARPYRP